MLCIVAITYTAHGAPFVNVVGQTEASNAPELDTTQPTTQATQEGSSSDSTTRCRDASRPAAGKQAPSKGVRCIMLCMLYAVLCCAMLCYDMLCYDMLRFPMLCCGVLFMWFACVVVCAVVCAVVCCVLSVVCCCFLCLVLFFCCVPNICSIPANDANFAKSDLRSTSPDKDKDKDKT